MNAVANTTAVVESKATRAQAIYLEELAAGADDHRARTIKRFKDELGMGGAGSSTYYQNCKKRANGEKVVHYRPKTEKKSTVDNSSDDVPESFELKLLDGTIKCFLSQEAYDEFVDQNASLIDPDQTQEAA